MFFLLRLFSHLHRPLLFTSGIIFNTNISFWFSNVRPSPFQRGFEKRIFVQTMCITLIYGLQYSDRCTKYWKTIWGKISRKKDIRLVFGVHLWKGRVKVKNYKGTPRLKCLRQTGQTKRRTSDRGKYRITANQFYRIDYGNEIDDEHLITDKTFMGCNS